MKRYKQYQISILLSMLNPLNPNESFWEKREIIEAKCLEDAQRRCGQLYGLGGRFYDSYLKVEEMEMRGGLACAT